MNFLSRLVFGVLFDILGYSKLMSVIGFLLSINLFSMYFVSQQSFYGLIISVWLVYILGFCHFSTIPAQVLLFYNKTKSLQSRERGELKLKR